MANIGKNTRTSSRMISRPDNLEGGEEIEIAAQITVPTEGGWGWVIVASSFICMFILDGVVFTFGGLLHSLAEDLHVEDSVATLLNSIAVSLYFATGPVVSAFINRYGFRACAMAGSVLSSFSLFISYFIDHFIVLSIFYGVTAGIGYCLISMSANLIVGFYFERLRSLAISIAMCGSSVGVMTLSPVVSYLVKHVGWRTVNIMQAGCLALIYFCALTYRPIMSFTVVTTTTDESTRTVTYLPSLATIKQAPSSVKSTGQLLPNKTERLFSAVSNANFPTAAAITGTVDKSISTTQAGPSSMAVSKIKLIANTPHGGVSQRQLNQIKSMMSKSSLKAGSKVAPPEIITYDDDEKPPPKNKLVACCQNFFRWEKHVREMRPFYRDDIFYAGKVNKLPIYEKSRADIPEEGRTGFEYQMAVSRAAAITDLKEKTGIFTTAVRRVLATMMNPALLKKKSFLLLAFAGFLSYLGYLVPYVLIQDKNITGGVPVEHCNFFVSAISLSNLIGRLVIGAVACKLDPIKMYISANILTGLSIIAMNISYNVYVQYMACGIFGFCGSGIASLRSLILVNLYGLDKLTNATGMLLLFIGIGSLAGPPLVSAIKDNFGYDVSFYVSGSFLIVGGCILTPIKLLAKTEKMEQQV